MMLSAAGGLAGPGPGSRLGSTVTSGLGGQGVTGYAQQGWPGASRLHGGSSYSIPGRMIPQQVLRPAPHTSIMLGSMGQR